MKILFFIHALSSGGAERVLSNLATYWHSKGWQITIVTVASQELDFYELPVGVERIALDLAGESSSFIMGLLGNIKRILALRRVLRRIQPDIARSLMSSNNVLLGFASVGLPHLVSVGSEHIFPPEDPPGFIWEKLRRYSYLLLDSIVVLTSETRNWISANTCVRQTKIIPNPVLWPLPVQEPCVSPNRSENRFCLLAAGRLVPQKGFDLLLTAFSRLTDKYPAWDLVVVGEGTDRKKLERQVLAMDLQKRASFPGRVGNIGDWYQAADIYVMSSRFEGFPNTLAEALASGLPAVSFDCDTGPRDIIRNGVDGFLVPPEDVAALAKSLDRLMGDPALRKKMGEADRNVRVRFSMECIAGQWERLFKRLQDKK